MRTNNFITLFNEMLNAISKQYPESFLQFNFVAYNIHGEQGHTHLWETDKIYLMAYHTIVNRESPYYSDTINIEPTDLDEIEDNGIPTITIKTENLTIVIAEDL